MRDFSKNSAEDWSERLTQTDDKAFTLMDSMKTILLITIVLAGTISGCGSGSGNNKAGLSSTLSDKGKGEIVFREYEHDFGKVSEGEKISYIFSFENKGTSDVVISSATASCGCTIPKYDAKPIQPGGTGSLEVVFDTSGREGKETKVVTVKSNAITPVVLIKITAEVVSTNK